MKLAPTVIAAKNEEYLSQIVSFQMAMAFESEQLKLDQVVLTAGVKEVLNNPTRGKYYLILEEDKLLGMMLTIPEWSDWRCQEVIWIHSVYILPEYRGKGLFKELYLHLKQRVLTSEHLAGLRLYVDKSNHNAKAVYHALDMNKDHYELYEWLK